MTEALAGRDGIFRKRMETKVTGKLKDALRKAKAWLTESGHKWHILGGLAVGLPSLSAWGAVYASIVAGVCLELKDYHWGGKWDNTDLACTIGGGVLAALVHVVF